jgi:hypothetical protein
VHEVGGDGVTYTQDRHTIRSGVVIRQILVDTGASRHALLTVLLDEKRYPPQAVFEARRSHGLPVID